MLASHRREIEDNGRNFYSGLMLAFVGVAEDLLGQLDCDSSEDALKRWPPEPIAGGGRKRLSLFVSGPQRDISLRGFYNRAERVIINDLRRYGYPSCAPHATQSWPDYREDLEKILSLDGEERLALVNGLWAFVLELPGAAARSPEAMTPRAFSTLLEWFSTTSRPGEPSGTVLQGFAFAYYRADAPNVTLETGKVRTGSARVGRVGDVDGWSGVKLVLSIEVKDISVTEENALTSIGQFLVNLKEWPDATAILVAQSFVDEARDIIRAKNILTLDVKTMLENVEFWDLRKQQLAMREFEYYVQRVERKPALLARLEAFVLEHELQF